VSESDVVAGALVHGRYKLLERVGGGGMGHVFRAEDTVTRRVVAVKLLHKELWSNADLTARLFQEARVISSIAHPNIVEILAVDASAHGPFIAMEYLDGSSVGSLLQLFGKFDEQLVATIMIPLLSALDAAHGHGVIHRDLKPENIFVCRERAGRGERGNVHLLDFGIAKFQQGMAEEAPRTRTGVVFGTPDYLSPEQATGEGPLDGRSDLFSVGIVMYELLSGRRPFTASTAVATAFRIVHATPPSFESLGLSVSGELRGVVRKLLAKSPNDRPASAREVLEVLKLLHPDTEARQSRLLRLLQDADDKRKRGSRPPLAIRSKTPPALGIDGAGFRSHGLSPRTHGRCARGPVLASIDGAIERTRGELDRERVVALLPDSHAEELRRGRPSVLDAHDIDVVRRYIDTAGRVLQLNDKTFRDMGRDALLYELAPFVRTLIRPAEFYDTLNRMVAILKSLFDFGLWSITRAEATEYGPPRASSAHQATIRITGFELIPNNLRLWLLGVISGILEAAGNTGVEVSADRSAGTNLEIEVVANS
jgi:serine/threonine protein kinase